ncbi:MAG: 6-phosphofructokinase, partial [Victivallaceae bacterium]
RPHEVECLVCVGGGGTHKSALLLKEAGLNIVTMPKTIDNDLDMTGSSIGFDTALDVATSAIDALHSTASSHRRIMLLEVMGHNAGWLTLGSGIAGGADVILIPEIPYDIEVVAAALRQRTKEGKLFSIVPVAEGAMDWRRAEKIALLDEALSRTEEMEERKRLKKEQKKLQEYCPNHIFDLASQLEKLTGLESRVTILGYLQRGGKPSCFDRLLASQLGSSCAKAILAQHYGVMVSFGSQFGCQLIALEQVAGKRRVVNLDHPWMQTAESLGICFGKHVDK